MIYSITGIVAKRGEDLLLATASGITFKILPTKEAYSRARVGKRATVFCAWYPESHHLYGFVSDEELSLFEQLVSVSGVGPKIALKIISAIGYDESCRLIGEGKDSLLARRCGVSARIASRVVVDLKKKMQARGGAGSNQSDFFEDALDALLALGYTRANAMRALSEKSVGGATLEETIKKALKFLATKK